jgi:hypothetical protein
MEESKRKEGRKEEEKEEMPFRRDPLQEAQFIADGTALWCRCIYT